MSPPVLTVVYVEDDERLARLTSKYLESHGLQVFLVNRGDEALAEVMRAHPDVVLLDLMLPGLDGHEVCRRIRERMDVPILMLTARGEEADRVMGLEGGADWPDVLDAIRETWASAWLTRTFEERSYYGVDHLSVGMALLVHPNFPDEEANGVAVTANVFDSSGLDPAFYVNVQTGGDAEVVSPPPGVTSDQFLYYFYEPNRPTTFVSHSSLVPEGTTVLTSSQIYELGSALDLVHEAFSAAYGPAAGNDGWYAMDVEFKFDDEDDLSGEPRLWVKQARPYPGRGD